MSGANGKDEPIDWRRDLARNSVRFSAAVVQNFRIAVAQNIKSLPIDTEQVRVEVVNSYVESVAGSLTTICCEVSGHGLETEEIAVKMVREMFRRVRQNMLMRPVGPTKQ